MIKPAHFFLLSLSILVASAYPSSPGQCQPDNLEFSYAPGVDASLSTFVISKSMTRPRGIKFDSAGNLLVVDVGVGVVALSEAPDGSSCKGWEKRFVVNNTQLNHGIEIVNGYLYASSAETLLRWNYNAQEATVSGNPVTIIKGMANEDHSTRTLLFQPGNPGHMIVNRGSESNIDLGAADIGTGRSQIRRFALNDSDYDWSDGELLAWGVRNGVALGLGQDGTSLWEVENSADEVQYNGIDVHKNNPAEELNLIDLSNSSSFGHFYGYPNCLTAWNMSADIPNLQPQVPIGSQFSIKTNTSRDDAWCQDTTNVVRPVLSLMAHSAPLDMEFYSAPDDHTYAINTDWNNDAFVSFHGSWNTNPPTGYGVVRIPWSTSTHRPEARADAGNGYSFILHMSDTTKCPSQCLRPVGLAFDSKGRLFVSSDSTKEIFVIENARAPDARGVQGSGAEAGIRHYSVLTAATPVLAGLLILTVL